MTDQINIQKEIIKLFEELNTLSVRKSKIIDEIDGVLLKIYSLQDTAEKLKKPTPPMDTDAMLAQLNENTKLGDAIETILAAKGSLRRKEIIELLQKYGVRISPKNPQQVLASALMRDKNQRFIILKDKRVGLRKGKNV